MPYLYETEQNSAMIPQLHSTLNQSSTTGVDQRVLEEQELASFRCFPLYHPQAFFSTQHPHLQPFNLHAVKGCGPHIFLTPSYNSAGPHLHAFQTPNLLYPNCIHSNTVTFPPVPTVSANLMKPGHRFPYSCQQPDLQLYVCKP